ncbi:hypothetical protein Bind_3403 [Beijerinckia indica subsp. indica ATCC 9039]|uniref:Uncharacterized protein n=1 Tax=Beijerinckia indica subsp. indica (strain ATCC 9039 / DSM 1715 / NCIMB 8712) TaxID=395963 RepID=B2IEM0_BEII9|nr:hypothetical protein Bind_3403 [Beijerinckia indica subsp. indica ATCC 9039]
MNRATSNERLLSFAQSSKKAKNSFSATLDKIEVTLGTPHSTSGSVRSLIEKGFQTKKGTPFLDEFHAVTRKICP